MSSYELDIQFTASDTQQINNNKQKLTIVKEVGGTSGSMVVWLAISPYQSNTITWDENYGVYASTSLVEAGATIVKTSFVNPASSGVTYPFENGAFDAAKGDLTDPNSYGIENDTTGVLTFGLAQSVTANGTPFDTNPLNAVSVLTSESAIFTPIEKLQVFLHAVYNNGVVISDVDSPALTVDLTGTTKVIIHYDGTSGHFMVGPLTSLVS